MNTAAMLDAKVAEWQKEGRSKAEIICLQCEFMLGWPYVWGASGQNCTVDQRRYFMNRSVISEGDANLIRKRCQILNGSKSSCEGCKYKGTRIQDCQGFEKEIHKKVGITLTGAGATSMYNNVSLWSAYGKIGNMPANAVCLVFKQVNNKMEHVGQHVGGGRIIHCSGEVKVGSTSEKGWTHFAIPKGMEGESPVWRPTIRKGSSGDDVRYCQELLIKLGYDLGSYGADGKFGAKTQAAVIAFQKKAGLSADGVVGPLTWEALENATPGEKLYTATIKHLDKTQAEAMKLAYPNCDISEE